MKLSISAVLCSSVASALSLQPTQPVPRSVDHGSKDILTAVGASSSNEVFFRFEAPYHGTDNGLVFDVAIQRANEACEQGHLLINRQAIEWSPESAEGAGTIQTPLANGLGNRELNATWKASCLANEAQILSFRIHQVGQDVVTNKSGFTISFKQHAQPEVLRLVGEAIDMSNPQDLADQWTHPDRPHRIILTPVTHDSRKPCLENEVLQLGALKAESHDLQRLIEEKKHRIHELIREDWQAFCSTIKECGSLKCIFRAAKQKILEYAHIISLHCRNHRPSTKTPALPEQDSLNRGNEHGISTQSGDAELYGGQEASSQSQASAVQHDEIGSTAQHDEIDSSPSEDHPNASYSPIPSQTRHLYPSRSPYPNGDDRLPISPTSRPHEPSYPRFGHHTSPRYYLFLHILPTIFILVILSAVAFLTLRHFKILCASPNRRASRLCAREERRNRRLYRRAARKHAWRQWWNRLRSPTSTIDYEEKRTLILEQEGVLEDAMQDEIRGLRMAQEIVSEMARAEEGRARMNQQANVPQQIDLPLQHSPSASSSSTPTPMALPQATKYLPTPQYRRPSSSSSFSHSQPADSIPPPRYSEELDGDVHVVDGFTYSPTFGPEHSAMHHVLVEGDGEGEYGETPDSSVIDCSPRMSFDTGRSTVTTATGMGKE